MKLASLYSRRSDGKIQIWEKEVDGNKHRSLSGIMNGEIVVSEWTICAGKNIGRANATTPDQQALTEAKAEWQKKIDKGYKQDIKAVDQMSFFEPMLAKVWQDYKEEITFPVFVQPKLDGIRLIANKSGLWTRNGKEFKSIPHIYEALKPLFKYNQDYIFDGEVYADKYNQDFEKISSLARKTKPTPDDLIESAKHIEYHIYDFPFWNDVFSARYKELKKVLDFCKSSSIKLVETSTATDDKEVTTFYEAFVEKGHEGLMVRQDTKYEQKRTKNLLKYKEFKDDEYLILDVVEGVGNRSGGAGAIVCRNKDGSTFHSNIKGTREFCREMLLKKHDYIGKMGTVKYFNLTADGVPRFPYFMRLREEE